ncbi:MAG TPA: ThuA domain-containing protein [Bacteroidota bacterium]|nr:ThuA domain-containing protein [Bacteroidota bacterium]
MRILCFLIALLTAPGGGSSGWRHALAGDAEQAAPGPVAGEAIRVLVFTKTTGFVHESKPKAIKAFADISQEQGWEITFTEDSTFFSEKELGKYTVVVFLLTTGDNILSHEEKLAFKRFVEGGGGFVGVHTATVTEQKWPWLDSLVGARFIGHPPVQEGKLVIENRTHPATRAFRADTVAWKDEFYSFDRDPRKDSNVHVLVSIDESSYNVHENPWFKDVSLPMGDHPLVWYQHIGRGRSFQTALGHTPESYDSELFRNHIAGAVLWAAGRAGDG